MTSLEKYMWGIRPDYQNFHIHHTPFSNKWTRLKPTNRTRQLKASEISNGIYHSKYLNCWKFNLKITMVNAFRLNYKSKKLTCSNYLCKRKENFKERNTWELALRTWELGRWLCGWKCLQHNNEDKFGPQAPTWKQNVGASLSPSQGRQTKRILLGGGG